MEFISSDTNVWIDFSTIQRIQIPFMLPYIYLMSEDAIRDELLSPVGLANDLLSRGLIAANLSEEEFEFADSYGTKYLRLSVYDRTALSIAKKRGITLLTGDKALREAAKFEGVAVIGTLGILDQLYKSHYIDVSEYKYCLQELKRQNGNRVRLPKAEIDSRLKSCP
jgi:predicted nucleic acid-binding protein